MKRKQPSFEEIDFSELHPNFFNVDKDFFMANKPLMQRLSSGYINFNRIKDDKEFYEKAVRYITRTAYTLFTFITKEQTPAIRLDVKDDQAYCGLNENKLHIGLKMLTYKKIPAQLKVDTIISTVFHEMYHKRYTIPGIKTEMGLSKHIEYYKNTQVDAYIKTILPDELMKSILNIIEDRRIEANGADDFPGYSFYFEESRKYAYYLHSAKKILPGYEVLILDFLMMEILLPELKDTFQKTFIHGLEVLRKFKDTGEMSEEEFNENEATHKKMLELFSTIKEYIKDNHSTVYSTEFPDVLKASKDIYDLIPKEIKDKVNEAISKNDIKGYVKITMTAGGKSFATEDGEELPQELSDAIIEAISDELEKVEKEAEESRKNQERKVHIEKIKGVDKNSYYDEYEIIEEPVKAIDTLMYSEAKKISKNICNNLGFLDSRFTRNVESFELSEGDLDEDELYSIAIGNKYLFQDVEDMPAYALDFGILLDESGSMSGRISEAKKAVLAMILGLKDNKHINLFVYGHTANNGKNSKAIQMYKYFNTLHRFTDYRRIFSATSRSNNADGYAIDKVADIMKESKARDKIMVVVSDGQPSAHGYGGASGEQHVQDVVNRLESEGITVIQVCMAYIENSPRMFKHFVPYEKDGTFFDNLKKILLTKLNQFADSI